MNGLGAGQPNDRPMPSGRNMLDVNTRDIRRRMGASSVLLFLSDPIFEGQFRLVGEDGVQYPELVYGPIHGDNSTNPLLNGPEQLYAPDARNCEFLRHRSPIAVAETAMPEGSAYGDFVSREGVSSTIRLRKRFDGGFEAVFFSNYRSPTDVNKHRGAIASAWLDEVSSTFAGIRERMRSEASNLLPHIVRMGALTELLSSSLLPGGKTLKGEAAQASVDAYLDNLLKHVMSMCGLTTSTGAGSIHLAKKNEPCLILRRWVADSGRVSASRFDMLHLMGEGGIPTEGIIALAAHRGRAVLIRDLSRSSLRNLHIAPRTLSTLDNVTGELAVPMFASNRLVGVLNIESYADAPCLIDCWGLPVVWQAAQQAAFAVSIAASAISAEEQASAASDILRIPTASQNAASTDYLTQLSGVVQRHLDCCRVDTWMLDLEDGRLVGASRDSEGSAPRSPRTPRPGGWTNQVRTNQRPVWIDSIESSDSWVASQWNGGQWTPCNDGDAPTELNQEIIEGHVKQALVLPIFLTSEGTETKSGNDEVDGLIWVMNRIERAQPKLADMETATRLCTMLGLAMRWARFSRENEMRGIREGVLLFAHSLGHDASGRIIPHMRADLADFLRSRAPDIKEMRKTAREHEQLLAFLEAYFASLRWCATAKPVQPLQIGSANPLSITKAIELGKSVADIVTPQVDCEVTLDDGDPHVTGDVGLLSVLAFNLIMNAKEATRNGYSKAGKVVVSVQTGEAPTSDGRFARVGTEGPWVHLEVVDQGRGVAHPEWIRNLGRSRLRSGTARSGVGLLICDAIAAAHRGRIHGPVNRDDGCSGARIVYSMPRLRS